MKLMRMALLLALLLLLSLLTFGTSASAKALLQATDTPTPSATWEPLFPTSTPVATKNYTCPTAQPLGWGTVTPDLLWSANCSPCLLTLTPRPTSTSPYPTATVDPLATSTPTPTSTPTEMPDPSLVYITAIQGVNRDGYSAGSDTLLQTDIYGFSGTITLPYSSGAWPNYGVEITFTGLEPDMEIVYEISGDTYFDYWNGLGIFTINDIPLDGYHTILTNTLSYKKGQINWGPEASGTDTVLLRPFRGVPSGGSVVEQTFEFRVIEANGVPLTLATPTPAIVSDYCAEVNGVGGSLVQGGELGIDLPQITVGQAACYGVSGISIPTGILSILGIDVDNFEIPGLEICFKPISFGTLNLFGIIVDLDFFVFVMGAVLGLRWVLRS